jgi:hypothetical protein
VGGGWALKIESFLGPVNWNRADRRVSFGAQKLNFLNDFFSLKNVIKVASNSNTGKQKNLEKNLVAILKVTDEK